MDQVDVLGGSTSSILSMASTLRLLIRHAPDRLYRSGPASGVGASMICRGMLILVLLSMETSME